MPPVLLVSGNTTTWLTPDPGTNTIHLPPDFCGGDDFGMASWLILPFVVLFQNWVYRYFARLRYTRAAIERLHSYLLLSFEHAADLARTCANAVDLLLEVKGDKGRMDDVEANIQALADMLETQVGELLSWMENLGWERGGECRLWTSIETVEEELKKKIEAIERVKDDLRAFQQRFVESHWNSSYIL